MVVLTPACTWATNIATLQQFNIRFVVCDNDLWDFGFSEETLKQVKEEHPDVNVIWTTHLMGSPVNMDLVSKYFPDALIIEDCCESHGADYNGQLVGTFGVGSTFSFYFGHHMTTIEGGMISTDDTRLFNLLKAKRSHGMIRDMDEDVKQKYISENPDIDPSFLFITDGFNARASDLAALIGISQLGRLDDGVAARRENHARFEEILSKYKDHFLLPNSEGNSSFCFPFICTDQHMIGKYRPKG